MPTKTLNCQTKQFRFNYELKDKDSIEFINPVLVHTRSKIFNFTSDKQHYKFTININEIEYNHKLYFEIQLIPSENYSPEKNYSYDISHPFALFFKTNVKFESFIVYKNSLTQILTEFLLMEYLDLELFSGATTAERYKFDIIKILSLFKIKSCSSISKTYEENNSPHYILSIIQKELQYESGCCYYDIEYNFKFIPSDQFTTEENKKHRKLAHPFAPFSSDDDTKFEGVIVYANELTKKLVEFLLMDYDQLAEIIDHDTPQSYKSNIMESLALLWD